MDARLRAGKETVGAPDGGLVLGRGDAEHLRAALGQMELLLACQQVDAGLCHLVDLLRHLRSLTRSVA